MKNVRTPISRELNLAPLWTELMDFFNSLSPATRSDPASPRTHGRVLPDVAFWDIVIIAPRLFVFVDRDPRCQTQHNEGRSCFHQFTVSRISASKSQIGVG